MIEFRMPALGAEMEAGTLVQWLKQPGDAVKRFGDSALIVVLIAAVLGTTDGRLAAQRNPRAAPDPIAIDYPSDESSFPPDIAPPNFLWRDPDVKATVWQIDVTFPGGLRRNSCNA